MNDSQRDLMATETNTIVKGMEKHFDTLDKSIETLHKKANDNKTAIATIKGAGIAVASVFAGIGVVIVIVKAIA